MSKKTMLLALAVASVTMFALPAASSAQEIHLNGVTSFSGDFTAASFSAEGEPTTTCQTGDVTGTVNSGGTTGSITLDFTGCTTEFFGFPANCHTAGAPNPPNNTIAMSGTFHLITTSDGPAMLVTLNTVTKICAGISNTVLHGNVIGTITSPGCGVASKTMTINFAAAANNSNTQAHELYTGTQYDLTTTTGEGGAAQTAVLTTLMHVESTTEGTLNCT
jgi:hypothetical protein